VFVLAVVLLVVLIVGFWKKLKAESRKLKDSRKKGNVMGTRLPRPRILSSSGSQ